MSVMVCPSVQPYTFKSYYFTYGIVADAHSRYYTLPYGTNPRILAVRRIEQPSQFVLLADTMYANSASSYYKNQYCMFSYNNSSSGVQARHSNRLNAAFLDGHVKAISDQDMLDSYRESIRYPASTASLNVVTDALTIKTIN